MSRLYGRAFDVYQVSKELSEKQIPKYKEDNSKISLDDLIDSTNALDIYLPEEAIDYIINYPIHIVKSSFIPRNMSEFPSVHNPNATIYFKGARFKEEQKRDLSFFLGCVLSQVNPDELPKNFDLPCEYGDLFPLLMEYLYLKENNKEEIFLNKHLNSLKSNALKYQKIYEAYQKHLVVDRENELLILNDADVARLDDFRNKSEQIFLENTLASLVPLSSVDGALQIIDKVKTKEDFKKIIKELYENPNNNRQELLRNYDIESFGYKRLRKELDSRRVKR